MPPPASSCPTSIFWCKPRGTKATATKGSALSCKARIQAARISDMGLLVLRGLRKPCVHQEQERCRQAGRLQAREMPTGFAGAKGDSHAQGAWLGVIGPDVLCHPSPTITCSADVWEHLEFTVPGGEAAFASPCSHPPVQVLLILLGRMTGCMGCTCCQAGGGPG